MTEDEIDAPSSNLMAEAIGEALLHDRARLPPIVLGQCEEPFHVRRLGVKRCETVGVLVVLFGDYGGPCGERFVCPRHGATLERAVRRWPR